jgi:hypothetical protein
MKPSLAVTVIVLDLNGLLADVRRKEAPSVNFRKPDATLPNGQRAYLNPNWRGFLSSVLSMGPSVRVVMYTSRLAKNSEPVEKLLQPEILGVHSILHGEDCLPPKYGAVGSEKFHPLKTVDAVLRAVAGCKSSNVIFVDDNPHRILLNGGERIVKVKTYDALADEYDSLVVLKGALNDIDREMLIKTI